MTKFKVSWIINGNLKIDAENEAEAEKLAQEKIVSIIEGINDFKTLGPQAIQGSAQPAEE